MGKFDRFAFAASPQFDEAATRVAFAKAVPLQTLIIYCYDPRAAEIPNAVAKWLGAEEYPGRVIVDQNGKSVASTTTIFPIVVAG
ncbi:MAG TPA: carbonic anhydrase, partial [Steroidobacteraceae bacterium]|nr:carbonic anhydrase [Steroidobacteraceae bacterium]